MIRRHEFNTSWWGSPVGIVVDAGFFELPAEERRTHLAEFDWVEYRSTSVEPALSTLVEEAGFVQVDTQLQYRIGLDRVPSSSSTEELVVRFADESPLDVRADSMANFRADRHLRLTGITPERLNERYARWSGLLIGGHPELCMEVREGGEVQGWFLSQATGKGLNLTLAMLHRDARISGMHLYQRAMTAYAARGIRVGWASFSVTNIAVLNILSALGARFTGVEQFWFQLGPRR